METFSPKRLKMNEDESFSTLTKEKLESNFSTSNFADIVKKNVFVDKTLLLKTIFNASPGILITAPRRFGKSTNIDMVKKFIEIQVDESGASINKEESSNYEIFKDHNLLIYQDQNFFNEYFATYPVIHVDFKPISGNSFDEILDEFRFFLHETFRRHPYLLKSEKLRSEEIKEYQSYYGENYKSLSKCDIEYGLEFLSQCLYKHFDKKGVYVLIDECDAPINNTMFKKDVDVDRVNDLLSHIFSNTLKGNQYVKGFFLTGLSYYPMHGLGGANNIGKYMFPDKHKFVKFFGLIESEIEVLFSKFNIDEKMQKEIKYYNVYCTGNSYKLFSMSVIHYLESKELESCWQQSGIVLGLSEALHIPEFKYTIEKLFQSISVRIKFFSRIQIDDFVKLKDLLKNETHSSGFRYPFLHYNLWLYLNFLLQQGYVTYLENKKPVTKDECEVEYKNDGVYNVIIPNAEIRTAFKNELISYYSTCSNEILEECAAVIDEISFTANHEIYNDVIKKFECVISKTDEKLITENERIFHSYLFGVLCKSKFSIVNYRRNPDLVITYDNIGIIIEMKYKHDSRTALEQIINEKYYETFDDEMFRNIEHKIYLGLNVSEDFKVTIAVLVNNLDINKAINFPM